MADNKSPVELYNVDAEAVKRVLMIAYHFPPIRGSSGVHRTLQFARHLPKYGWEGLVVSVSPRAYPMVADDLLEDLPPNLVVQRAFAFDSARHLSLRGRYLGLSAFPDRWVSWWPAGVLACFQLIRRYRPHALWSTYPVATAHLIGLTIRKATRLPWVADFRDPMVLQSQHASAAAHAIWRAFEKAVVRNASHCVFATNAMKSEYEDRFFNAVSPCCSVIENGYDEALFEKAERDGNESGRRHNGGVRLLHSGLLYAQGRNPTYFFEALKQVLEKRSESVSVTLRGSGTPQVYERIAAGIGLSAVVTVSQHIGYGQAIGEMLRADALILIQESTFNAQIPAKAYEYVRSGRPILALVDPHGDTARFLQRWDGIYYAPPDSLPSIRTALTGLLDDLASGKHPIRNEGEVNSLSRIARAAELSTLLDDLRAR